MKIIRIISRYLFTQSPYWRKWRIRKNWQNEFKPFLNRNLKLKKSELRSIKDIWGNFDKINPLFHEFYAQKTGKFCADYIPDDIYYSVIDQFYNNPDLAQWLDDKVLYGALLKDPKGIVKQPNTLCMKSGGFWVNSNFELLDIDSVVELIKKTGEVFIKKSVESCGGKGVIYCNTAQDSIDKIKSILNSFGKNLVVQEKIKQSPILASLNESSVNTLRLISFLKPDGSVKIYSVVLRMGINGAVVDNASSGGITIGVQDDGRLKNIAYTARGVKYSKCHPDSKVEFQSIVIPNLDIIKEAVVRLHHRLMRLRLLSWDFAIDDNNQPILVEVNMDRGQLDFHQLNNGPLFGDDLMEILNEVYGK